MIRHMSFILCSLILMVSTVYASNSAGEAGRWTPFEFGTLDLVEPGEPIQIFGTDASVYGLRFSIFHARSKNIVGIDFGPIGYNKVENDMTGLQVGAGVNHVGGRMRGVQIGLINYTETLKGLQIGAVNIVRNAGKVPVLPIIYGSF